MAEDDRLIEALKVARSLIAAGWCRKVSAHDAAGQEVDPTSDDAVAWDLGAALERASNGDDVLLDSLYDAVEAVLPEDQDCIAANDLLGATPLSICMIINTSIAAYKNRQKDAK